MAKGSLFANYWCYIASGTGSQAEQTFNTLEKLANDNIDTFSGSTGKIFKAEVEVKNAAGDGFSHSSNGFNYSLYDGSMTMTLNSNTDAKRGLRGSVVFDESGFLSEEMMDVYSAFAIVNKSLKTGKDASGKSIDPIRQRTFPTDIPNQKFYISSASSTDTKFYQLYREFSKKQIMGDPEYCVFHLPCDIAFNPTLHGEVIQPLLSRSTVENAERTNLEKARREYWCIFTTDAGADACFRRGVITRNEVTRKPLLYNDTGDKKFVIAYDPARSRDNSIITVMEIYDIKLPDGSTEKRGRIVACFTLADIGKKMKTPMQTPDQIKYLKQLILDYDGGTENYDNILGVYIDAGSGGGGVNIADFLMEDWIGADGSTHRGLIDKEYSEDYVRKFPNAVDKVKLISPSKYKSIIFEAAIELTNQNKIEFTSSYDNKGYLTIMNIDAEKLEHVKHDVRAKGQKAKWSDEEIELKITEAINKLQNVDTKIEKLDWKEELALVNIDALKEELVNIVRKKRDTGNDSFDLTPEKAHKLHDDRCYTYCLCAYALMQERRANVLNRKQTYDSNNMLDKLVIRKPKYR